MRKLAICATAAFVLSTSLALAQGSGAAGDIGSGTLPRTSGPAVEQGTVGQSGATPATSPAPKADKKTAKKKSAPAQ